MTKVLVDTCVFVDFLRGQDSEKFESLILNNLVLLSDVVALELYQGIRKTEITKVMRLLASFEKSYEEYKELEYIRKKEKRKRAKGGGSKGKLY